MGYTTEFKGEIAIDPPLSQEEIGFLRKFSGTRRMSRKNGPYYVDAGGMGGLATIGSAGPLVQLGAKRRRDDAALEWIGKILLRR